MSGPLIGLVLLVAPRWSWRLAVLLLLVEGVLWNVVLSPPYLPAVNGGIWVLIAAADGALGLFGLVRLAQMTGELAATQDELAKAAVLRERLSIGERLVGAVEDRVSLVARHARSALRWLSTTPEDARNEMVAAGRIAREAVSEGRRLYEGRGHLDIPSQPTGTAPTPQVARAVLAAVLALFAAQNLLNVLAVPTEYQLRAVGGPLALVVTILVSVATPLLHWRHSESEFATATSVLEASGIDVTTHRAPTPLAADADTTLAIVLREAVTNVLRHSTAHRCAITLATDNGRTTLRISNDGAPPPADAQGRGLANMRNRVEALGGLLTTKHSRGTFVVVAEL
ncbi:hypothetical protein ALI144C_36000 [Actinosynnema sp. ALI-1.44]|uniref:sensor histidine kinase n=1 Tax=Actinosynnema sp. ALI-1.44 TaxID=1933779 RepID=UPI00097C9EC5|nr:sensor histidine kinase [Actinosynnema sp. ALI-1.44]ONI76103.1 hypothetical protein ALI144C_36000 [Actinosynnema sp. ALI-1.44]